MNKHHALGALLASAILLRAALPAHAGSLTEQLRDSSWQLVSQTDKLPNGNKVQALSQDQIWIQFIDRPGQFITGTEALSPEGLSSVDFGAYSIDEKAKTITFPAVGTSSPGWMATDAREFEITEITCDQMTWKNPPGVTLVWQRNDCPVRNHALTEATLQGHSENDRSTK